MLHKHVCDLQSQTERGTSVVSNAALGLEPVDAEVGRTWARLARGVSPVVTAGRAAMVGELGVEAVMDEVEVVGVEACILTGRRKTWDSRQPSQQTQLNEPALQTQPARWQISRRRRSR